MKNYKRWFNEDACTRCGVCLEKCPELQLAKEDAEIVISNMINGDIDNIVMKNCTSCFSCNLYCPNDCNPYYLILSLFNKRYNRCGVPSITQIVLPNEKFNIWSRLKPLLPPDEKKMLKEWAQFKNNKSSVLLTGCFTNIFPYLIYSKYFNNMTIIGTEHLWCSGGHIFQLGLLDAVEQIGKRHNNFFDLINIKQLITFMDAEYIMLTQILPKLYDINFNFEIIPFLVWLDEQIQSNKIPVEKKLKLTVTLHDNCFSKANSDDKFFVLSRKIVEITGCKLIEMQHCKKDALCCGFGAGVSCSKNSEVIKKIIKSAIRRIKEAEETGADSLVTYCSGCLLILSMVKEIIKTKLEIYHIFELVQLSSGEVPLHRHKERAWQIISIMISNFITTLFKKNIKLKPIPKTLPSDMKEDGDILLPIIDNLLKNRILQKVILSLIKGG